MTQRERRACFQHAKKHVIEAIQDIIHEEHHSVMKVDGVERSDMQELTVQYLCGFLRRAKKQQQVTLWMLP